MVIRKKKLDLESSLGKSVPKNRRDNDGVEKKLDLENIAGFCRGREVKVSESGRIGRSFRGGEPPLTVAKHGNQ